ncbi:LytTR family DNA-binding domain-containing protein [Solibacillus sp. FSL H8-0538]|uniref:LytTR family DNA-binding domain-containing protein n=1 Tax=Solibacillus sp. FSL H8-0538 TaxID=2921400 RepID=UPI0030F4C1CA
MKVHLKIEEQYTELEVHIHTNEYTDKVAQLVESLKTPKVSVIEGYDVEGIFLVKPQDIYTIYAEDNKVFLQLDEAEYETKYKIYELEAMFEDDFIRASKSILIQLNRITSIQFRALSSTVAVLSNGVEVPISRKYLKLLKERLMLRRGKHA